MPGMQDPNFAETLTLVCEHNAEGALGFTVNRPYALQVSELLQQQSLEFDPDSPLAQAPLFAGGPVQTERGFILHSADRQWQNTLTVGNDFAVTSSEDIIHALLEGTGPQDALFLLGYSGWGPGQLEDELAANAWLTSESDPEIVFKLPVEQRWRAAAAKLGVDLSLLGSSAGHA